MAKESKESIEKAVQAAADAFARVESAEEMRRFFNEILTPGERRTISLRWRLMERLRDGATQRGVARELGISLCKITRGVKILKDESSVTVRLLADSGE
ncbi:MAG: transcriptional regulator [Lentisphaerae bacterium]|jgi:TrpR family trp operon transcriptional repressor|nr:transcriptional regulator [Lentisphaerota bacterium]